MAIKNYPAKSGKIKLYNWLVDFLVSMSTFKIRLHIIMDGIKPQILSDNFVLESEVPAEWEPSRLYNYANYGVDEIIEAVNVCNNAGYEHSYFFAPYEATPQVVYLHDNYCGGNLMLYPDLLLYGWYNYIMDIDIANEKFEWVKYKKEHKLNEARNLPKVFMNFGYYISKGQPYEAPSFDTLRQHIDISNDKSKSYSCDKIWMYPMGYLNTSFQIEKFKGEVLNTKEDKFDELYGRPLGNLALVSLFRGLLSPKVCEHLSRGSVFMPELELNMPCESKYTLFNVKMNDAARRALTKEDAKTESDSKLNVNDFIHSKIMNEELASSSSERINTINFMCKCIQEYQGDSTAEQTFTNSHTELRSNQVWPYLMFHLCKEIGVIDQDGLTEMGAFFASHSSNWLFDQQLIIVTLMLKLGMPVDLTMLAGTQPVPNPIEFNAVNLIWSLISLLDVKIGEPWEPFDLEADPVLKKFGKLTELIMDGINSYLECQLNVVCLTDKLVDYKNYSLYTIKFKWSQGIYFATLLKLVLLYNFPNNNDGHNKFTDSNWPWAKYISLDNFVDLLKEALTFWDSVYKLVSDLTQKSKVDYVNIAFSNAEFILKSKINELGLRELF